MGGRAVGVVAVPIRRRQFFAPSEAQRHVRLLDVTRAPRPLRLRRQSVAERLGIEAADLAILLLVERIEAVLARQPVAILGRFGPGDAHHRLLVFVEVVVLEGAGRMAAGEGAELAVGHLVAAEVEQPREIGGTQRLVGTAPRLPARRAHADRRRAQQHELVAFAGGAHAAQCLHARLLQRQEAHLQFLHEARLRHHRLAVAGVPFLLDLDLVRHCGQADDAGSRAVALAIDPQLRSFGLCLDGQVALQCL